MKITILTFESLGSGYLNYHIINSKFNNNIDEIIISKIKNPIRFILNYLKKYHLKIFMLKIFELLTYKFMNYLYFLTGKKLGLPSIQQLCVENKIKYRFETNINSKNNIKKFSEKSDTIFLSIYFDQIIKKDSLQSMNFECYNLHPALLPSYGGPIPTFWVLYNKETKTGITLHKINEQIDEGINYYQKEVGISSNDTVQSLYLKLTQLGLNLIFDFLNDKLILNKNCNPISNNLKKSYYSFPASKIKINFKLLSISYLVWWLNNIKKQQLS